MQPPVQDDAIVTAGPAIVLCVASAKPFAGRRALTKANVQSSYEKAHQEHATLSLPRALLYEGDFTRDVFAVQPLLARAIHPQNHEKAFPWKGLYPVFFVAFWCLGCEKDIDRAVIIENRIVLNAVHSRKRQAGLQHRSRLRVVESEGPEIVSRRIWRKRHSVRSRSIERFVRRIEKRNPIIRASSRARLCHSGGHHRIRIVKGDPRICVHGLTVRAIEEHVGIE